MPKYRSKPQEVEAVQWRGDNIDEVRQVFTNFGAEYLYDKGVHVGSFLIRPQEGGPFRWTNPEDFHEKYALVREEVITYNGARTRCPSCKVLANNRHKEECTGGIHLCYNPKANTEEDNDGKAN